MGYAALQLAHLLAVVLWVGGMAFAHLFLRPAAQALEPPLRLPLMQRVLQRFLAAAGVAVLVVLGSGAALIALGARRACAGDVGAGPGDGRDLRACALRAVRPPVAGRGGAGLAGQRGGDGVAAALGRHNLALGIAVTALAVLRVQ